MKSECLARKLKCSIYHLYISIGTFRVKPFNQFFKTSLSVKLLLMKKTNFQSHDFHHSNCTWPRLETEDKVIRKRLTTSKKLRLETSTKIIRLSLTVVKKTRLIEVVLLDTEIEDACV